MMSNSDVYAAGSLQALASGLARTGASPPDSLVVDMMSNSDVYAAGSLQALVTSAIARVASGQATRTSLSLEVRLSPPRAPFPTARCKGIAGTCSAAVHRSRSVTRPGCHSSNTMALALA